MSIGDDHPLSIPMTSRWTPAGGGATFRAPVGLDPALDTDEVEASHHER